MIFFTLTSILRFFLYLRFQRICLWCDALAPWQKKKQWATCAFFWFCLVHFKCCFCLQRIAAKPYSANKAKQFFTDFFFFVGILFIFSLKKHIVLHVERLGYEFADMFVTFVCISYFALQICIRPRTRFSSHKEKKVTKFVYFFETRMHECWIFWINIMVSINLVVNSMLYWIEVKVGRLC